MRAVFTLALPTTNPRQTFSGRLFRVRRVTVPSNTGVDPQQANASPDSGSPAQLDQNTSTIGSAANATVTVILTVPQATTLDSLLDSTNLPSNSPALSTFTSSGSLRNQPYMTLVPEGQTATANTSAGQVIRTINITNLSPATLYPGDKEILDFIRSFGWELSDVEHLPTELDKRKRYTELTIGLFNEMPELPVSELNHVIFYGYISGDEVPFMVTRPVRGQIRLRLLHRELSRLQAATEKTVRKIIKSRHFGMPLEVTSETILVYERGHNHVIMNGRAIPRPFRETFRSNRRDTLLTFFSVAVFALLIYILFNLDTNANADLYALLERLIVAPFTTALVSFVSLLATYLDIRRKRIIDWKIASPDD